MYAALAFFILSVVLGLVILILVVRDHIIMAKIRGRADKSHTTSS